MNQPKISSLSRRSSNSRTKRRQLKRQLSQKENGFVLDCLNAEKSKLKVYHSISDKNLHYFVIRAHPNRNRPKPTHTSAKTEIIQKVSHTKFQQLLQKEKQKILSLKKTCLEQPLEADPAIESKTDQTSKEKLLQQIKRSIKYKARDGQIKQQGSYAEDSP